jgi:hypothetical protein
VSASAVLLTPRVVSQVDAYNGGSVTSTIALACPGLATVQINLGVGELTSIRTGWTSVCTSLTVRSSNGWDTNFDNFVLV